MSPTLIPPSVADVGPVPPRRPPGVDPVAMRLMGHYAPSPRYLWVLKVDGVYVTRDHPPVDDVNAATEAYDRPTVVSETVGAALTAAGYTVV